jgi:hypothetical protein
VELDVTKDEQILKAVEFVKEKYGRLDGECFHPRLVFSDEFSSRLLSLAHSA